MNTLPNPMSKPEIIQKLQETVHFHLSESTSWPAGDEAVRSFWKMLEELGLTEVVAGKSGVTRVTTLGFDCEVELASCFIGAHERREIPGILEEHGLISKEETEALLLLFECVPDSGFLDHVEMLVRRAHRRFAELKIEYAQA